MPASFRGGCPVSAGRTVAPVKFPTPGVLGEEMQASGLSQPPRLGISELCLYHLLKSGVIEGFSATVDKPGSLPASSTEKHPEMPLGIHGQGRIVVRIINGLFVLHDMGLVDLVRVMIVHTDHG